MKKKIKVILFVSLIVLVSAVVVYMAFREITPLDDTNSLYIKCNNYSEKYEVYNGKKIEFATNDDKCKLNLEIRNIERNYIKLNSSFYLYKIDNSNKVVDGSLSNEIFINPKEELVLYAMDKETKFTFSYK